MEKHSGNSFLEVDRAARDFTNLAKRCCFSSLSIELYTIKLLNDLACLFGEGTATDQSIAERVAGFRQGLVEARYPEGAGLFIGAIVGLAARMQENADTSLIDEFETELRGALSVVGAHRAFSWSLMGPKDVFKRIQENINTLMHATMAVCNFDPKRMVYASQQGVDQYFYRSYYHGIKRDSDDIWAVVKKQRRQTLDEKRLPKVLRRGKHISHYQEMGDRAHRFTNTFFNFLYRVSGHPRCSRALRTCIRAHLIDFTTAEAAEQRGWGKPFDVSRPDLRVSKDDIAHTNAEGTFVIERGELSDYCYDA